MGVGGREASMEGDICIHIADLLHCTAETNSTVKQFYSNQINKYILKEVIAEKSIQKNNLQSHQN